MGCEVRSHVIQTNPIDSQNLAQFSISLHPGHSTIKTKQLFYHQKILATILQLLNLLNNDPLPLPPDHLLPLPPLLLPPPLSRG